MPPKFVRNEYGQSLQEPKQSEVTRKLLDNDDDDDEMYVLRV